MAEKRQWPELLNKPAEGAEAVIKASNARIVKVQVVNENSPVTMDYSESRVRVVVNANNVIVGIPTVG
eukprot:CAMPEP_0184651598 /NCGR_PEP_ID=MMETSP0308-20130426/9236_1 /TAXON_ID=38269 /ORGANISM="Gloeochaete witrockiana, Strain SAG 46.84" /LENGTH=67 /DNA_ID=CAMNT_0027085943 /DNA_START=1368 /DNA_END=1571 /DNA_ORIENTATION=+